MTKIMRRNSSYLIRQSKQFELFQKEFKEEEKPTTRMKKPTEQTEADEIKEKEKFRKIYKENRKTIEQFKLEMKIEMDEQKIRMNKALAISKEENRQRIEEAKMKMQQEFLKD